MISFVLGLIGGLNLFRLAPTSFHAMRGHLQRSLRWPADTRAKITSLQSKREVLHDVVARRAEHLARNLSDKISRWTNIAGAVRQCRRLRKK
jgi:hypothetical protein